ncbi:MAG: AraC family transcriptional regulator [Defluviitaleaceae bacterium]|nr:AraC family transcriptional regulator [Defluviitaleaceae bacterium]
MNWIQTLSEAIDYIEAHLTDNISIDKVSSQANASGSHFQFVFHVVMGITIGEYIRNRRLSLAAQDLLQPKSKIIDVAMRYQYDTQESFSKAFTRFHGIPPSKAQRGQIRQFRPLSINITIQGGFDMSHTFIDGFHLVDWNSIEASDRQLPADEKYKQIVEWSKAARGQNPAVFDALTEWILDDSQWSSDKLAENEQILMQGVFSRFKEQNTRLRTYLKELEPSGVVNAPVFKALDDFDKELSGTQLDKRLHKAVSDMFADFTIMKQRDVREKIAGGKTGRHGTDSVELFGYINHLKNCDAQVQWCLFMPDTVKRQQDGFQVDNFEYRQMPAMRFIGHEAAILPENDDKDLRLKTMRILDTMPEYKSGFDYDILFMHHYGRGVDVEPWHGFWGRFMKADTPVPEGLVYFDLIPEYTDIPGLPFLSQFAFAAFSGDVDAMHKREGYDSDAMYDVTRNIILGQGVGIPYPEKYWTAEVFLKGCEQPGTAYMFSTIVIEGGENGIG